MYVRTHHGDYPELCLGQANVKQASSRSEVGEEEGVERGSRRYQVNAPVGF